MIEKRELIWLDPQGGAEHVCIGIEDGKDIRVNVVQTLDQIPPALGTSDAIIVRLIDDCALLREMQLLMQECGVIVPVITRVERGRIDLAVHAMRQGAAHVVAADERRPAVWAEALASTSRPASRPQTFIFADPVSQKLLMLARRVAETDVTALLTGPTGSGKEVLAKILHEGSKRRTGPFVPLNCAAMPESMIEDLLFGHEKGAFTGALHSKIGQFELANGGTIFLDEIVNLTYDIQVSLLRVIQERKIRKLGSQKETNIDVRIIVASNEKIYDATTKGKFREDLYHRFNEFSINLPPLRERNQDILIFANYFLEKTNLELNKNINGFNEEVENIFLSYIWPGNLREMNNTIKRASLMAEKNVISAENLPQELVFQSKYGVPNENASMLKNLPELKSAALIAEYEKILEILRKVNFNKSKAAILLQIDRKTLYNKMKHFNIFHSVTADE